MVKQASPRGNGIPFSKVVMEGHNSRFRNSTAENFSKPLGVILQPIVRHQIRQAGDRHNAMRGRDFSIFRHKICIGEGLVMAHSNSACRTPSYTTGRAVIFYETGSFVAPGMVDRSKAGDDLLQCQTRGAKRAGWWDIWPRHEALLRIPPSVVALGTQIA